MKNLKVKVKLILSFAIVGILATIVGGFGAVMLYSTDASYSDALGKINTTLSALADMREAYQQEQGNIRSVVLQIPSGVEEVEKAIKTFQQGSDSVSKSFADYEKTITDEAAEAAFYHAYEAYEGAFATATGKVVELARAGDYEGAMRAITEAAAIADSIASNLDDTNTYNSKLADDKSVKLTSSSMMTIWIQIIAVIIAVIISLMLAFYVSGLISKPLAPVTAFMKKASATGDITLSREDEATVMNYSKRRDEIGELIGGTANFIGNIVKLSNKLREVAGGNLAVQVDLLSEKDTIGNSIKEMVNNLNDMFGEINTSTEQVTIGANQVSDGSQALAQGSTEQASSVEELSASVIEISEKTKQNASLARDAANMAESIKNKAEEGIKRVDNMMQAVTEISEASKSISKIIKTIDDIAFQTNILALNAAVEAARAGQHGKGFAVVAEEVRNLASKSAQAAKDTNGMIADSMEKSNLGLTIATETSAGLREFVDGIMQSIETVAQIAQSSDEQAIAISQINIGIDQVSQVIQQNSATAEESAAASEEMSGQASLLQELVGRFKLLDSFASHANTLKSSKKQREIETYSKHDGNYGGKY